MSPKTPPKNETIQLIINRKLLKAPPCVIDQGSKPSLPNNFIKKILPKTPTSVSPVKPKEYSFLKNPNRFAPIIPMNILINEIKVPVIIM